MSKTNYEILEQNKSSVIQFADGVKSQPIPSNDELASKYTDVQRMVSNADLSSAIQKLDEIKDNKIGIVWHESSDLGNGTKALVRDARGVTNNLDDLRNEAGEKYAMQILNGVRAGMQLLDQADLTPDQLETAKQKLMHVATTAVENPSELNDKNVKEFNTQIIHTLEQTGIGADISVNDQLNFAKETANLHDDHKHIVTLTSAEDKSGQKHTVMEAEIMLNGLTSTQKGQYEAIAASKPDSPSGVEWFDKMPQHKQNLLRDVAPDIASGKKIIPTQLLGDAVGLRNAYQKVTAIKGPEQDKSHILSETLHCGAPATKIKVVDKEARQQIVDENIKQLQSFAPPGEKLNLNVLNSKTPFNARNENFIFDQVKKGGKNVGTSVSASPINRWRLLGGGRDTSQFKDNLSKIGGDLQDKPELENVAKHLKKGTSTFAKFAERITFGAYKSTETKAKQELEALSKSNPDLARDLSVAVESRNLADSSTLFANSQNVNLELTSKMNIVRNSVKHGSLTNVLKPETVKKYPNDVNFCKSGKDRTGYVQKKDTQRAVANHLGIDPKSKLGQKNFLNQVAGGHTQEMAGIQGGTTGCHSIKTNPEFALNPEDKMANKIVNQKSSHFNSKIKTVKEDKKVAAVIKKFEQSCKTAPKYYTPTTKNHPRSNAITSEHKTDTPSKHPRANAVEPKSEVAKIAAKMRKNNLTTSTSKTRSSTPGKPPSIKDSCLGMLCKILLYLYRA
ncbi:MAG: hypothetical protein AAF673_02490, partial [Pseudomonadota bacterium]